MATTASVQTAMVTSVPARLFGPGLPSAGLDAAVTLAEDAVVVEGGNVHERVAFERLQLREVGFGVPGVELAWECAAGRRAAHILRPEHARDVVAAAKLRLTPEAARFLKEQRRARTRRGWGLAVLAALLLGPLLLLLVFLWQADRIAGWIAARIPVEQEVALGDAFFAQMRPQMALDDNGPALAAVTSIGARLTQGSRYSYRFHVVRDGTINAFALPGGIIVVHSGLIDATKRPEELAGVLAHEVQHVEQRHSLEQMVKQLGLSALWSMATGDLGATLAGQAARELTGLSFTRAAEREADETGFETLVAAGIDPAGMRDFFATLAEKGAEAPAEFLSTHPQSEARREALNEKLETLGARQFTPLPIVPWPPRT